MKLKFRQRLGVFLFAAFVMDRLLSTVTGAVPIHRSKALGFGIVTGAVLGLYLLATR